MKIRAVVLLLAASVAFSGCDSISDATSSVREKLEARNQPRVKTVNGTPRVVFDAVKLAASNMGYRQTRGGPAQGEYEGVSTVDIGEAAGRARQVSLKVRLHATLDGANTEVSVRFTEILESDSSNRMGMATETMMKDTPLYEVFFRNVQQALSTRPSAAPVK